jgi:hypothetical protein
MRIIEVTNNSTVKQFLEVGRIIYKNDDNWVCPLDFQIENIFNPNKNPFHGFGEATRWILQNQDGELIGRIAAFINNKKAFGFDQPTGGIGFFECINDKESAFKLFDTAKAWLQERKMEAMDGPINFGENDNFWGLLVEGFMHPGVGMQYNHDYYQEFFESYGFKFYFDQVTNHLDLTKPFPERFWKIAEWVAQKPGYEFKHFDSKNADKFINDLIDIYNDAWQFHENFQPFTFETISKEFEDLKNVVIDDFIWFAYHEGEPIAFEIMLPDINQITKRFKGKLNLINKLRYAYLKNRAITRSRIVIMGVKPKYQKSGVESAIFWHMDKMMKKYPQYTEIELSWVGDFNPKMRALHESVGATFAKRHVTYRCLFKDSKEFKRSTIIPIDTKEKVVKEENENKEEK